MNAGTFTDYTVKIVTESQVAFELKPGATGPKYIDVLLVNDGQGESEDVYADTSAGDVWLDPWGGLSWIERPNETFDPFIAYAFSHTETGKTAVAEDRNIS